MKKSKGPSVIRLKPAFEDERGEIWDILDNCRLEHVGFIRSKKGSVRGNHYHKRSTQYTFVLDGKIQFYRKDLRSGDSASVEKLVLGPGDLAIDPPGVAHAVLALEDSTFLDMMDVHREGNAYEDDTVRIKITE